MPKCPDCGALYGIDDDFCPECGERLKPKEKEGTNRIGFISMYECPICHMPGIPVWRKACLDPAYPTNCKNCGKKVGVPYSSMLAMLPFIAAVLVSLYMPSLILKGWALIIGIVCMFIIHMKFVPLISKE
ncbi:MAG: zinc ribbon domain-containing protein [Nanoarchaeota archaeon]|nr:zinc ribbon domain-containing protein [Nanoarchaeota archaeon]